MLEKGLVSIITPCYNGEKHIFRLLNSILNQTYEKIEMFVVDDGSTDKTKDVVQSYISKFESKGYSLTYVYQSNSGQAAAINKGLSEYKGEYLVWPDSDDFYSSSQSLEKMVRALNNTDESISMVRTNATIVNEDTLNYIREIKYPTKSNNFFYDCILERKFSLVPGKFLVKTEILKRELNDNKIYDSRGGQNWQLLLPVLCNYKLISIHESLYTILERKDSHSRKNIGVVDRELDKIVEHEDILQKTILGLKDIKEAKRGRLQELIKIKYNRKRLSTYYNNGMKKDFCEIYVDILKKSSKSLTLKDHLKCILIIFK